MTDELVSSHAEAVSATSVIATSTMKALETGSRRLGSLQKKVSFLAAAAQQAGHAAKRRIYLTLQEVEERKKILRKKFLPMCFRNIYESVLLEVLKLELDPTPEQAASAHRQLLYCHMKEKARSALEQTIRKEESGLRTRSNGGSRDGMALAIEEDALYGNSVRLQDVQRRFDVAERRAARGEKITEIVRNECYHTDFLAALDQVEEEIASGVLLLDIHVEPVLLGNTPVTPILKKSGGISASSAGQSGGGGGKIAGATSGGGSGSSPGSVTKDNSCRVVAGERVEVRRTAMGLGISRLRNLNFPRGSPPSVAYSIAKLRAVGSSFGKL